MFTCFEPVCMLNASCKPPIADGVEYCSGHSLHFCLWDVIDAICIHPLIHSVKCFETFKQFVAQIFYLILDYDISVRNSIDLLVHNT